MSGSDIQQEIQDIATESDQAVTSINKLVPEISTISSQIGSTVPKYPRP
jgi:hypothetical protein